MDTLNTYAARFNNNLKNSCTLLLLMLLCFGCKKIKNPGPEDGERNIYQAGKDLLTYQPAYWKNGELTILPTPAQNGTATCMDIEGGVYVGGWHSDNTSYKNIPCYWSNTERHDLPLADERPRADGMVYSIDKIDGTVFSVGSVSDSLDIPGYPNTWLSYPCYWANGNLTILRALDELGGGGAMGVSRNIGNHVGLIFIVGQSAAPNGYYEPCYWGHHEATTAEDMTRAHPLTSMGYGGFAADVKLENNRLIIAGSVNNINGMSIPCYWSDGERTDLDMGAGLDGGAVEVMAADGKIYVAGSYTAPGINGEMPQSTPCIWIDGVRTDLPLPAVWNNDAIATTWGMSCFVFEGDVYVSGSLYSNLCYWKNGELIEYNNVAGNTSSIIITR